jgi:hypothetical protein
MALILGRVSVVVSVFVSVDPRAGLQMGRREKCLYVKSKDLRKFICGVLGYEAVRSARGLLMFQRIV